ncbi:MAG TPA: IS481 family transposase [Thermodesulfovibrionales bacterium]|nr:IS481 family transposase [Thermodesulfovibrionales bacterium]
MQRDVRSRLSWVNLYKETGDAGLVCRKCGISRPTLRKWIRRYEEHGEEGLLSVSRRPHRSPNLKVTDEMRQWITEMRSANNLGARRIQNELKWLHSCKLSLASIHKVLRDLQMPPLRKTRRFREPKRYARPIPGDRVQIDTCKIRPGVYLYTAVDDCSRYMVLGLYPRRTAKNTIHFLTERVLEEMHFPIQRLQSDNGKEFTAYSIQDLLRDYSIKYRPIRPASPYLNGKVERAQQTVLCEFFAVRDPSQSLAVLEDDLACWQHYYNWERIHGSTGVPPIDKISSLRTKTPFWDEVINNYSQVKEQQYEKAKLLPKRRRH